MCLIFHIGCKTRKSRKKKSGWKIIKKKKIFPDENTSSAECTLQLEANTTNLMSSNMQYTWQRTKRNKIPRWELKKMCQWANGPITILQTAYFTNSCVWYADMHYCCAAQCHLAVCHGSSRSQQTYLGGSAQSLDGCPPGEWHCHRCAWSVLRGTCHRLQWRPAHRWWCHPCPRWRWPLSFLDPVGRSK